MSLHSLTRTLFAAVALSSIALSTPAFAQANQKLQAGDGEMFDLFGWSVAVDNGVLAVGAMYDNDKGSASGSAYLFNSITGQQLAKLNASDGAAGDEFGHCIAVDDGIVAVGAWRANGWAGAAYLFDAATGVQLAKLVPNGGQPGDWFGKSIAIDNGLVIVGASNAAVSTGTAYVFDVATGAQLSHLTALDAGALDEFGWSVDISNGVAIVGSYLHNAAGNDSGAAYLFDATTGSQLQKLVPFGGKGNDRFGHSVAIDSGVAAVGTVPFTFAGSSAGSVFLFDVATGTQTNTLTNGGFGATDFFGFSLAMDSGKVVVGAPDDGAGTSSGSAFVFDVATGVMSDFLKPFDGAPTDSYGVPVAIDNGLVIVGSPFHSGGAFWQGAAYTHNTGGAGSITPYGFGSTIGAANIGVLGSASAPSIGTIAMLDVAGFTGSSALLMMVSANINSAPFAGGTVLIDMGQTLINVPFAVTGGAAVFPLPLPPVPGIVGLTFFAQCGGLNSAQAGGFAFSNGLAISVGL